MSISIASEKKEDIGPSADMAEETSDRQTEKIGPNADVAEETSDKQPRFVFDETKKHTPVFYLTEIPDGVRLFYRKSAINAN